jgi:hypothetical protein
VLNPLFFALTVLLSVPSSIGPRIERSFLSADAGSLRELLPREGAVIVSLPDPLSFSDVLSDEQTYFLFKKIFALNRTVEFSWETDAALHPDPQGTILKARWAFRSARRGTLFIFSLFFLVAPDHEIRDFQTDGQDVKILEIRAERL